MWGFRMNIFIDLFSGLGGASQAFEAAGWEVVTVDINPEFNPTICCNVEDLWLTKEFKSWSKKSISFSSLQRC